MPTLLRYPDRAGRTRIEIYTQDHAPSHVHVNGVNAEAVLLLNCCETDETRHGPVSVREVDGYRLAELNAIIAFVAGHLTMLCRAWRQMHGAF
jgi:hypothetical protein